MAIDPRFFEQARTFINETMRDVIPNANVDGGSGINQILGRGGATISAALLQEIEHVLTSRDLTNPDSLTETDMDLLLENLLTARDGGDLAFGFVRLFYSTRQRREFAAGLTGTTEGKDVRFETLSDFVFDPQDYFVDSETGLFYINVPFVAEEAGEAYNVDVGEINQLTNDTSGASRVTNVEAFRNGAEKQTNAQALRKAQRSISTRTPLSRDGAIFFYQDLFGSKLKDMLVVGAGDAEMLRDEVYDLGDGANPRFQIGVDGLDPVTRAQLGSGQELFVGGRTDIYSIFETINYVQKHVDLFADMLLDTDLTAPSATVQATFVPGTTGEVAATGKLIIDLGNAGEEVSSYSVLPVTVDGNTYTFTLDAPTAAIHVPGATVKVVNNSDITAGVGADITVLPVFQISEVRLLDPVTFEPIGDPIPPTTAESREPGWYIARSNPYDLMSAKETKSIIVDEKRDATLYPGNQAQNGTGGTTADLVHAGATRTKYTTPTANFTGYQGRSIDLSGGIPSITRTILQVLTSTEVIISGDALAESAGDVSFVIDATLADYNEFPVRISYYTNTEIQEAQQFLDQDSRRILGGDALSRAFFPVFIDFTLQYRGDGSELDLRDSINDVLKTSSGDAIGESEGAKFEYSDLINAAYTDDLANYVVTPFEVRVRRLQIDGSFKVDYVHANGNTVNRLAVRVAPGTVVEADGSYTSGSSTFTTGGPHFALADVGRKIWILGVGLTAITAFNSGTSVDVDVVFDAPATAVNWSFPAFFLETRRPTSIAEFVVPQTGRLYLGGFTSNVEEAEYDTVVVDGDNYTFVLSEGQSLNLPHGVDEPLQISRLDYIEDNVITDGVITDERTYRPFLGNVVIEKLS